LSRDLQPIHAKSFVNGLHLVLQISKIPLQNFAFLCFCVYGVGTKQGIRAKYYGWIKRRQDPIWERESKYLGERKYLEQVLRAKRAGSALTAMH
jgi:hypothetical protein